MFWFGLFQCLSAFSTKPKTTTNPGASFCWWNKFLVSYVKWSWLVSLISIGKGWYLFAVAQEEAYAREGCRDSEEDGFRNSIPRGARRHSGRWISVSRPAVDHEYEDQDDDVEDRHHSKDIEELVDRVRMAIKHWPEDEMAAAFVSFVHG